MKIELLSVKKAENNVVFQYSVSDELREFFGSFPFIVHYCIDISSVPDSVLAIPFVCNVLPVIWLEDAELIVPELDKDFFDCIDNIKNGFRVMYPDVSFCGKITVGKTVEAPARQKQKPIVLFSGGADATTTLFRHIEEKPLLVTLWGADVPYDKEDGWNTMYPKIQKTADNYELESTYIRSAFRKFDSEHELDKKYRDLLGTGWWYGIKHGIGIIGHTAPLAYLYGSETVYIASSNCPEDGDKVKCASDPKIDNMVRFCGCKTVHDGFELDRQKKVKAIVDFHRSHPEIPVNLHVCWKSTDGENCCHCEKCYRTMAEFWIEGEDPRPYGFGYKNDVFEKMRDYMTLSCNDMAKKTWTRSAKRLNENWDAISAMEYAKKIAWIRSFNFMEPEKNLCRKVLKIKTDAYSVLSKIKMNIPGRKRLSQIKNKPFIMNWSDKQREEGLRALYLERTGCGIDFEHPTIFNEKIQWYKLYYSHPDLSRIVCKVNFKKYIAEKLGDDTHTIPLIGAWTSVEDIPWDDLPDTFVLKSNAQSDGNCIKIIKNKADHDWNILKKELKTWLNPKKTLLNSYCRAYYDVTPMILAEEYFEQFGGQLLDYKFFCFGGEPRFAYVASDHFIDGQRCPVSNLSLYDLEWNILPTKYGDHGSCITEPPVFLEKMVAVSKLLAKDFPFVRVDFFETADNWYLSELTFYPGGGFKKTDAKAQEEWGKLLNLPKKNSLGHKYRFDLNM